LENAVNKSFTIIPEVKTMDEASEIAGRVQNLTFADEGFQYEVFLIQKFRENESLVIFRAHHVIGDGIAFMIALSTLQEKYSKDQWI